MGGAPEGKNLEGILKWSLSQSDGTAPARPMSEEDRKWLMSALEAQSVDVVGRMKEITALMKIPDNELLEQGVTVEEIGGMLEELQEHVESIDLANDLKTIGGLTPLLHYLQSPHAGLRSRAAEVITTAVQNNPKGQANVLEAGGLEMLLNNFSFDPDTVSKTKALGALSSLLRHNKPALEAFRSGNGYAPLKAALSSDVPRFQRKALTLFQYLMQESPSDRNADSTLGFYPVLVRLVSSPDDDVREAALQALLEFTEHNRWDHLSLPRSTVTSAQTATSNVTAVAQPPTARAGGRGSEGG